VAYLIDPSATPLELLDAIFSACSGFWGGRLSPIIPVIDGKISSAYWQLLLVVDPDRIYSYTDLPQALLDKLMKEIDPLQIQRHSAHLVEGDHPHYHPSHNYELVRVHGLLPRLTEQKWFQAPSLVTYDGRNGASPDRLIARNFGILNNNVLSEQIPKEVAQVTFNETFDFASFLEFVSIQQEQLIFPYAAAAARAVVDCGQDNHWTSYTLFVGGDVADWVAFWNQIFTIGASSRERWKVLCIPPTELKESRTIDALTKFLKKLAYRNAQSPPYIDWVSLNHTEDELRTMTEPFLSKRIDGIFRFSNRAGWFFPELPKRERYTFDFRGTVFGDPELLGVTLHQLPHTGGLVDVPGLPFRTRPDDRWIRDVRIEYRAEQPYYANEDLVYQLPRRSGTPRAFCGLPGRIDADGGLSFEMRTLAPLILTIPEDRELILSAIGCGRRVGYDEAFHWQEIKPAYQGLGSSDKARYCRGVLNLCGGLQSAHRMFENRFWRRNLYNLAGISYRESPHADGLVYQKIMKHPERWTIDSGAVREEEVKRIESQVLKLARYLRTSRKETTYLFLKEDLAKERAEFLELNPEFAPQNAKEVGEAVADSERRLKTMLQEMTGAKILQQGTISRCLHCGSRNWHELSTLEQEFKCTGCGGLVQSEVEATWYYRLNALMRGAITEHGTVALIGGLSKAREKARHSFMFSPGLSFFEGYDDQSPKVEIDAICLVDGEVWIGEVKSRASEFKAVEMIKLVTEAKRLGAERAFVFALEGDQEALQRHCRSASESAGIKILQLYPSQFASQPAYHL
jgi:hypothetical protein